MDILTVLQWLVPSGALGGIAGWLTNKTLRSTRTIKEVHDTYKAMYEDIQETLIGLQNENKELYKAVKQLNRTLQKAINCRHYAQCPLRDELQNTAQRTELDNREGQLKRKAKSRADP